MGSQREEQFKQMVAEFPDSPMGHFSLGKLYLEERRYAEAVKSLEEAIRLDADYAAAMVSLGDAYVGAGAKDKARAIWERARSTALGQKHASLADEIDERINDL
jgi:uncharacterized protein HemY